MSLRDRLAAKARRRVSVRVQVTDPGPDLTRLAQAATFLLAAQADPERAAEVPALQGEVDEARDAVASHSEVVWFAALPPVDFEALVAAHTTPAGVDADALCVALAAECAEDEGLRDSDWWAAQLHPETGSWTSGERDDLYHQLFTVLHYSVPSEAVPKG